MLKDDLKHLDYFSLLGISNTLDEKTCSKKVKMALLADCAPQQLATVLKAIFYLDGIFLELYEADFDSIELEAYNPQSGLYTFNPEIVFIMNTTQSTRHKYYATSDKRSSFTKDSMTRMKSIWSSIRKNSDATIIQSNLALPMERFFGNFDTRMTDSLSGSVREINYQLVQSLNEQSNVFLVDIEHIASMHGRQNFFDEKLWVFGKTPATLDMLPWIAQGVVDISLSTLGQGVKCVICDLDNTLWGGVIGDDGLEGIALGHLGEGEAYLNIQNYILELKKRGIILAVCSKNDHDNAILPFQKHSEMVLKEEDISVFVANWDNKADNIKYIQKILNIGFDSMVFFDDNPFERNLVRDRLPEVIVPELPEDAADYISFLNELNLFETTTFTEEDKKRAEMYRAQAKRNELESSVGSIDDYLQSLEMKIHIARFDTFNLPRIAQLIQRSNQFNLTTSRFTQAQCSSFMLDQDGHLPLYIKLQDKFGDYGLISVVILRLDEKIIHIDEWLMSCRVLSRGVESCIMNYIFDFAKMHKYTIVKGYYKPSPKNKMVMAFYNNFDFAQDGSNPSKEIITWSTDVGKYKEREVFLIKEEF